LQNLEFTSEFDVAVEFYTSKRKIKNNTKLSSEPTSGFSPSPTLNFLCLLSSKLFELELGPNITKLSQSLLSSGLLSLTSLPFQKEENTILWTIRSEM